MAFIEWSDKLMLGIAPFDEHHKHLVDLLNQVYDDISNGVDRENMAIVFKELIDYTVYHFGAEEAWLQSINYPAISQHVQEHATFTKQIIDIHEEFLVTRNSFSFDLLNLLQDWLLQHILKTDAEYVEYMATRGTATR